ncbi:epidermal growth factor receptor kinase substrate 8-like protein 3 [Polymixia lowei]
MFRSTSPYGHDTNSYADSIQSIGYSTMDDVSSQTSGLSRPNAKSIYMQRKEYAASINKMMDKFQYRVEHLFTCDLDEKDVQTVGDCVERLKLLDGMGRVWGQDMLLEVRGGNLLLRDIETKEELETLALSSIHDLDAVLDSGVYNSLLTVSVQDHSRRTTSVFMFQCEELRADYIKKDLSRALSCKRDDSSMGSNLETMAGHQLIKNLRSNASSNEPRGWKPPDDPVSRWSAPDYEDDEPPAPVLVMPREVAPPPRNEPPSPLPSFIEEEPPTLRPYRELDRNVDILNHIFTDLEIFMGHIAAVVAKDDKKKKKKKKNKAIANMPPVEDFVACLQKIKYGFNLLGELNGKINNPSVPEFVHCIFSTLGFVVAHCPENLPSTIVAPLLTPDCIRLLSEEASTEEDHLWQSLGDPWNIPSTKWPEDDEDIPTYTLEFFDGWQPPALNDVPQAREPLIRQESQHSTHNQVPTPPNTNRDSTADGHALYRQPSPQRVLPPPLPPPRPDEPNSRYMRVMYDFTARNYRELSITKGEVVELLDMSKQWWKVRNTRREEGFVPNNVLESLEKEPKEEQTSGPLVLARRSKPAEVKAWLEYKGFSKITVRCLGMLSGSSLLGMTREELKTLCPEEGGRVFFQLQAVKSALALASEARGDA